MLELFFILDGLDELFFILDGWAFKNNIVIKSHRNLQERIMAAQMLLKQHPLCPVVLDTMENLSSNKYAALPERLYVLQKGKVVYKVKKKSYYNKVGCLQS